MSDAPVMLIRGVADEKLCRNLGVTPEQLEHLKEAAQHLVDDVRYRPGTLDPTGVHPFLVVLTSLYASIFAAAATGMPMDLMRQLVAQNGPLMYDSAKARVDELLRYEATMRQQGDALTGYDPEVVHGD